MAFHTLLLPVCLGCPHPTFDACLSTKCPVIHENPTIPNAIVDTRQHTS